MESALADWLAYFLDSLRWDSTSSASSAGGPVVAVFDDGVVMCESIVGVTLYLGCSSSVVEVAAGDRAACLLATYIRWLGRAVLIGEYSVYSLL